MCLKITDSFLQDLFPLPYSRQQRIRTGQMTSWRDASKHRESATRSPTHPPPPSSGSRDANEPSAKFSQSRRRPLLGAFNQHKAQVGAFSVIVKTLPMVRLQLYRRACWRDCGHGVSSYPADVDRAERDDFGCEDAANVNQRYASQPGNNWIKEIKMIIVISKIVLFNFKKFYLI